MAAVESIWKIKEGLLFTLSEQQLVDCDLGNRGCSGGNMARGFQHIIDRDGILEESQYPYQGHGKKQDCQLNDQSEPDVYISSYKYVQSYNEQQLLRAVAQQPVSVGIAPAESFRVYKSGFMMDRVESVTPMQLL